MQPALSGVQPVSCKGLHDVKLAAAIMFLGLVTIIIYSADRHFMTGCDRPPSDMRTVPSSVSGRLQKCWRRTSSSRPSLKYLKQRRCHHRATNRRRRPVPESLGGARLVEAIGPQKRPAIYKVADLTPGQELDGTVVRPQPGDHCRCGHVQQHLPCGPMLGMQFTS